MSKFCGNCGAPLSDDALFCAMCGHKAADFDETKTEAENVAFAQSVSENVSEYQPEPDYETKEKPKKKRKKWFFAKLIISLTLVLAILAGVAYGIISHYMFLRDVRVAVCDFVDAIYLGDDKARDKLASSRYEKELYEYLEIYDYDDMCDDIFDIRSKLMDKLYGDGITVTSEIVDFEYVPFFNEYTYYDLVEFSNGIDELEYDSIYRVKVKIDIKGDDKKDTFYHKLIAIKTDDEWNLYDLNGGYSVVVNACYFYTIDLDRFQDQ